ncbi:MAG: NAD-dependent epimerase/dehydratase family protein, partial [Actinomycetota bacterium]
MDGFWQGRKVVITGGAGFLGTTLCRNLTSRGAPEITIPRSTDYDLRRADDVERLFTETRPDLVIHLAARVGGIGANMKNPADLYLSNLLMGTHVIEQAHLQEVEKTVVLGTICSYPKFTPVPFK